MQLMHKSVIWLRQKVGWTMKVHLGYYSVIYRRLFLDILLRHELSLYSERTYYRIPVSKMINETFNYVRDLVPPKGGEGVQEQ